MPFSLKVSAALWFRLRKSITGTRSPFISSLLVTLPFYFKLLPVSDSAVLFRNSKWHCCFISLRDTILLGRLLTWHCHVICQCTVLDMTQLYFVNTVRNTTVLFISLRYSKWRYRFVSLLCVTLPFYFTSLLYMTTAVVFLYSTRHCRKFCTARHTTVLLWYSGSELCHKSYVTALFFGGQWPYVIFNDTQCYNNKRQ